MVKLRDDLTGVVYLNGQQYGAGDEVPDGVRVGAHLTEDGQEHGAPEPVDREVPDAGTPLTHEEVATAEALGLPTDAHSQWVRGAIAGHQAAAPLPLTDEEAAYAEKVGLPADISPERIRGALVGYEQGIADTIVMAARGTEFDPSDANVEAVQKHIAEHPRETAAVLALEAAGKARRTILDEYLR